MVKKIQQSSPVGQSIFFETVESSHLNRGALAIIGLALAKADQRHPVILSHVLGKLQWDEFQAVLSMLSLSAHAPVIWKKHQLAAFKLWAKEPQN